jgi:hypothetical protein
MFSQTIPDNISTEAPDTRHIFEVVLFQKYYRTTWCPRDKFEVQDKRKPVLIKQVWELLSDQS